MLQKSRQSYWQIVELIEGVVLEQLHIVKVHWSCPLALLCKVQRLLLAKQSGYTFKEAQNSNTHILYWWLLGVGCDILSSPHSQHLLYFILITRFNLVICFCPGQLGMKLNSLTRWWDVYPKGGNSNYATINPNNLCPVFTNQQLTNLLHATKLADPILHATVIMDQEQLHCDIL